jgi:replicative DNA helicase Mcm
MKTGIHEYFSSVEIIQKGILKRDLDNNFVLDMKSLLEDNPSAQDYFINNPEEVRLCICNSLKLFNKKETERFKIINFDYLHHISILRVEHMDKLIKVKGMISKTTKVIALVINRKWECPGCGTIIDSFGPSEPRICPCGRRKGFKVVSTKSADIQEIELEELQEIIEDRQPQKIRVRFMYELCDKQISGLLQPGNKIEVIGIVEKIEIPQRNEEELLYEYRLNAYDVNSLEEKFNEDYISEEDIRQIKEIALNKPLDQLSNSLAPSIYGHEDVKKAIVLQMASGVKRFKSDGSPVRDRSHILICGDPGTGKSQMVKCAKVRMPKSYYVSGDESSKAGLVAMVEKDELLKQWAVKAGALSKSNDSILVIDEADKLDDDDRNALHTPMESGEIVINKAGIHTTLKAQCSILAAANPKDGMFDLNDPHSTLTKQINLPPTLLSRFDLIFVMTDKIDEEADSNIVDSIYSNKKKDNIIDIELFRKYITYIKKLEPQRREDLVSNLKKFYTNIRSKSISPDSKMKGMPITPRHIEGILRLAEAHAKLRMSEYVEEEDLKVAQDLFFNSLVKIGMDESTGLFDGARLGSGKTLNNKLKAEIILEILREHKDKGIFRLKYDEIINISTIKGLTKYESYNLIRELKNATEIYEPEYGYLSIVE